MTQNIFKCSNCGSFNYVGDSACRNCRQQFQYNCPFCGSGVKGGSISCDSCGNSLSWPVNHEAAIEVTPGSKTVQPDRGRKSWIWPLIGLILVIAVAVAGSLLLIRMMDKPAPPVMSANVAENKPVNYVTPDTKAPVITNIAIRNISYNAVEIAWNTDELSTSQVEWRVSGGDNNLTLRKDAMVKDHSVELVSLLPKTTYYYRVISSDQFANVSESEEKKFDIGRQPGTAKVEVLYDSMSEESPPPLTFIRGVIRNTGDIALRPLDIEVAIVIEVAGRQGTAEVIASLDKAAEEIKPGELRSFAATVPNNTKPIYTISPRILY
jgi:hypothetical protein